jgi:uncharacterized glyoxalase superfamily protein PhnB
MRTSPYRFRSAHHGPTHQHRRFGGFTLAHNVASRAAVDAVLAEAVANGATLQKPASEAFWGGYSGYFCDPDGHPWEVAHNPFIALGPDGSLILPE